MSELIDFGLCGKWQRETLIAHCVTGKKARSSIPDNLLDSIGMYKLSVFEPEYAYSTYVIPPLHLVTHAMDVLRKKRKYFWLEKLIIKIPNARIIYDKDSDIIDFTSDYIKLLNYIKDIDWKEFEKIGKEKWNYE